MRIMVFLRNAVLAVGVAYGLAGCGPAPVTQGIQDPYEEQNRAVHRFNKSFDRNVLRPIARGTGGSEPGPVATGISNFAGNLTMPTSIANDVLQFQLDDAAHNFTRFLINTTFGIGGIFDPATAWGLYARDSDFGETLHVWGVGEGNYVELPFLGPSTERDTIGTVADIALNPLRLILPKPERYVTIVAPPISKLGDRGRYSDTVDSILYDSADSYAQTRLLYLQNRRFQLGQEASTDDVDLETIDTEGF